MDEGITSLQNPLVKEILGVQQKAARRKSSGLFVAEGRREVSLAMANGFVPQYLLICRELFQDDPNYPVLLDDATHHIVYVSRKVYNKLAYREDAEGVMIVGSQKTHSLNRIRLSDNPLILVLEGIEKPGNLGAVLRTADAAGVDALLLCNAKTDLYNPNAIRASMGCTFTVNVGICNTGEFIQWVNDEMLWKNRLPVVYAAALQNSTNYMDADFNGPVILAFGEEAQGLSEEMRRVASKTVHIPMAGSIDSLNLAASVAILTFEAVRQRRKVG